MLRRLREVTALAFQVMMRRPAQSALTVLGLTIGVGAFIAMVSFGEGARRSVISQFEALGANVIKVGVASVQQTHGRAAHPLTDRDVAALRRETTAVAFVSPVVQRDADATRAGKHHFTRVYATLPRFADLHNWELAAGGMYDDSDLARRAKVCVIGTTVVRELFDEEDPLGQTVTVLGGLPCNVLGVLASKGHATNGDDLDDVVLVPLTTAMTYLGEGIGYSSIEVEPEAPALMETAKDEITDILRRAHGISPNDFDDFKVSSPLEVVRAVDRTTQILSHLLQSIAALSLLVGGIGVMNIQLVSVAERTIEIGIRSAIGASPRQIMRQFLAEAAALSLAGAISGVVLGMLVATIVAAWMGWPRVISPIGVVTSALFGIGVGVVFGYLPARRAADLDPVEALRHE